MKSTILALVIGSLVLVDGSLGTVTAIAGTRGCKGDTKVTVTLRDGSEVTTGWREPTVKDLHVATLAECEAYFTGGVLVLTNPESTDSVSGGVDVVAAVEPDAVVLVTDGDTVTVQESASVTVEA